MNNVELLLDLQNMSVAKIGSIVDTFDYRLKDDEIEKILEILLIDGREGVRKIGQKFQKKNMGYKAELIRLQEMMKFENEFYSSGLNYIAGVDEAGRGPLAGPVVAAAVILPKGVSILGVNDSKKLSLNRREELYDIIIDKALAYQICDISHDLIDNINILNATKLAMKNCIDGLKVTPEVVLVDAVQIPDINMLQKPIIKGDALSVSIAAASILAKVTRDRIMDDYHKIYPQYNFNGHKGYGTKEHIELIQKYGPCHIHRKSFIKNFI